MGRKFTIFALFYFVFEGKFQVQAPRGAYIWRGDLTEGFLRYRFGGLIFGGAYTWRGLFSEFYGMRLYSKDTKNISSVPDKWTHAACCILFGIQVGVRNQIRVEQTHAFYHFPSVLYSFRKPHTTPRTIPDRAAKLLDPQRLLRTSCFWSPATLLPTLFTKLIIRFLNTFLRKQNNTEKYFRNSRLHLLT